MTMSMLLQQNFQFDLAKQQHAERIQEAAHARLVASLQSSPTGDRLSLHRKVRNAVAMVSMWLRVRTQVTT